MIEISSTNKVYLHIA